MKELKTTPTTVNQTIRHNRGEAPNHRYETSIKMAAQIYGLTQQPFGLKKGGILYISCSFSGGIFGIYIIRLFNAYTQLGFYPAREKHMKI